MIPNKAKLIKQLIQEEVIKYNTDTEGDSVLRRLFTAIGENDEELVKEIAKGSFGGNTKNDFQGVEGKYQEARNGSASTDPPNDKNRSTP